MRLDPVSFLYLEAEDLLKNFNSYRQIRVQNFKICYDTSVHNYRPSQNYITFR